MHTFFAIFQKRVRLKRCIPNMHILLEFLFCVTYIFTRIIFIVFVYIHEGLQNSEIKKHEKVKDSPPPQTLKTTPSQPGWEPLFYSFLFIIFVWSSYFPTFRSVILVKTFSLFSFWFWIDHFLLYAWTFFSGKSRIDFPHIKV